MCSPETAPVPPSALKPHHLKNVNVSCCWTCLTSETSRMPCVHYLVYVAFGGALCICSSINTATCRLWRWEQQCRQASMRASWAMLAWWMSGKQPLAELLRSSTCRMMMRSTQMRIVMQTFD